MKNVAGRVPASHDPWPWVRPFGRRNRRCVQGWQYCPSCLEEDDKPFLRLHWRLAPDMEGTRRQAGLQCGIRHFVTTD